MRFAAILLSIVITPTSMFAAKPLRHVTLPTNVALSTSFSVSTTTAIPGGTLAPGEYTIRVVEHLTDRVILQVTDKTGKVRSLFLGLTTTKIPSSGSAGPISWSGQGSPSLRGFIFPGAPPVEFVYPKAQAVAIAKSNTDQVLAIDPASDNLSIQHDQLSKQDMQIVTLWTLKSTRVGPDTGIEAAKYEVPATPAASEPILVGSASPSAQLRSSAWRTPASKPAPSTASSPVASVAARRPTIAVLPHTASNLPLMLLAGVLALLGSAAVRLHRVYSSEV